MRESRTRTGSAAARGSRSLDPSFPPSQIRVERGMHEA